MYDAMYHFVLGLHETIQKGQDYEIPKILNLYLKQNKFTGCDGTIVFEKE